MFTTSGRNGKYTILVPTAAGQQLLREGTPILFYPAAALAITVLTFMMLGDVLRDALDPKARTR
mgnify:CR=1 FL=1